MANLHKFTVQESLNASTGNSGNWSVNSRQTINATGGTTIHLELNSGTHILLLQPTVDTQISFTIAETDIVANDDISIPGGTLTSMQVPRGIGNTIILNMLSNSASTGTMRVVEV
jgi:hypothetical protein